ncbi:unnamed protein product, partial [Rotaria sp. Silwood2]
NLNKVGFQQKVDYDYGNDILEENEDFFIVAGTDFENDSYVSIGNSVVDYDDESNDGMSLSADENNSPEPNFNTNNISIDHENIHQHNFLSELVQFIHAGNLNKSTTTSLLSLLRSAHFSTIEEIPKTTNALWKKLSIKFCFDTFYFCSTCFTNLNKYQDLCPHCNLKRTANSELCIFSLGEEIKRVVQSNIDVIEWYSLPERQIVADLILSFLAEIPPPLRENVNNILLLGLWHSPVTPPCALLLNKIVDNIKLLIATGINVVIKDEIIHFSLNVQLFNGDLPARAKVNRMVNHNGFYACSRCLFEGERCLYPCGNHTIYKWEDFVRTAPRQRTQEHINTEVMSNRTTTCITPSRIRKVPRGATNIQTFDDDLDCYEYDECDVDENFPIVREVPIYNHQHRQSSSQHPTHRRKDGIYYTPQTKRKRVEERVSSSSTYSNKDQIDILQLMLKEVNQKMDLMHKKEDDIDKKLDSIDKRLVGLARKVNKCPKPCEPPNVLPVIKYNGRNLLSGTIPPTPAGLMKDLINELFTKEEIIDDKHEQINERTEKIKAAIQAWFFYDDDDNITSFWDFEGKIIRGNQRRGHIFRQKHALADQE